jgi:hypothetical protein
MRDAVALIMVVVLLLSLYYISLTHHYQLTTEQMCESNLARIKAGFTAFAEENDCYYWVGRRQKPSSWPLYTNTVDAFRYFLEILPYVALQERRTNVTESDLNIFVCPADERRPGNLREFNNAHLSYFISLDATRYDDGALLFGDRNLTNKNGMRNGILEVTTNTQLFWSPSMHSRRKGFGYGTLELAGRNSVEGRSDSGFVQTLLQPGLGTNRLLFPE